MFGNYAHLVIECQTKIKVLEREKERLKERLSDSSTSGVEYVRISNDIERVKREIIATHEYIDALREEMRDNIRRKLSNGHGLAPKRTSQI